MSLRSEHGHQKCGFINNFDFDSKKNLPKQTIGWLIWWWKKSKHSWDDDKYVNMFKRKALRKSTLRQYNLKASCFLFNFATHVNRWGFFWWQPSTSAVWLSRNALTWTTRRPQRKRHPSKTRCSTNYVLQSYSAMRTAHRWCKRPRTVFKKTLPFFVQAIRIVLENLKTSTKYDAKVVAAMGNA